MKKSERNVATERWLVGAGLLMALLACKKSAPPKPESGAASAAAAASAAVDAEAERDGAMNEKIGHYITCLNEASDRVRASRNRYLQWVNEKTGPTGKEPTVIGLYAIDPDRCVEALKKAAALPTKLPQVDPLVPPYQQALLAVVPLTKEADEYYTRGNYKDDKMAKGKAMHGPLVAAFSRFVAASKALDDAVSALNDQLAARRLARLSRDPTQKLHYLFEKASIEGKKLVRIADVRTFKQLDQAALEQAVTTYEKTFDEMTAYATSHKAESDKMDGQSYYLSEAKSYLVAAKELMRRKRESKDFAMSGSPQHTAGHPANVLYQYNRMVEAGNRVRFKSD